MARIPGAAAVLAVAALLVSTAAVSASSGPAGPVGEPAAGPSAAEAPVVTPLALEPTAKPMASFEIRSLYNEKCLDVAGGNSGDGAAVHTWTCNGGANQRWHWHGDQLRSDLNGKCLDVVAGNSAAGAVAELWSCNFANNQRWRWSAPYLQSVLNTGLLLTVAGGNPDLGVPAILDPPRVTWPAEILPHQKWTLR